MILNIEFLKKIQVITLCLVNLTISFTYWINYCSLLTSRLSKILKFIYLDIICFLHLSNHFINTLSNPNYTSFLTINKNYHYLILSNIFSTIIRAINLINPFKKLLLNHFLFILMIFNTSKPSRIKFLDIFYILSYILFILLNLYFILKFNFNYILLIY